ncbi:diacylglycerol kinase [Phytohabitans flavus]|uniref:Diacylglycerol kinase n=1 Tax=Phytohabitans flavus TaxID=1076124 RepID=A0A6F8XTM8_9ACTN|nr:diacylglycerol kinase family protein [Phytohabitans flavus]BCB77101.1 diacylglycerol kinase [Phytohabitans flavus]
MSGELVVLANPEAGRGRHRDLLPQVLDRLAEADLPVRLLDAGTRAEAQEACHSAAANGAAALVAVGGDGTVHLALQAVAGTDLPFGAVPAGTGNDFAVETGVPAEPIAAAAAIADAVKTGRTRPIDLARLTGPGRAPMWYGSVLAAGFDAVVNERANQLSWPRGPRRYDLAIALELLRLKARRYTLRLDGDEQVLNAVLLAVGNCASYGGGIRIVPTAVPTDGLLDVVLGDVSRGQLVRLKGKTYKGTHVDHPQVHTYRARTVEIEADGITTYVDGERAYPLPVTITAVPGAVRLLG